MTFASQLVHTVLAKEIIVDDANQCEMWFGIGSVMARFSKQGFV